MTMRFRAAAAASPAAASPAAADPAAASPAAASPAAASPAAGPVTSPAAAEGLPVVTTSRHRELLPKNNNQIARQADCHHRYIPISKHTQFTISTPRIHPFHCML